MIYVTGDIHGSTTDYRLSIVKTLPKEDIVIFLGDFGYTWRKEFIDNYSASCITLFIAGNHENFDILNSLPTKRLFGSTVGVLKKNVYHLRTGNLYNIEGKKFLVFGGALSIDKATRLNRISWWEEEIPSFTDMNRAVKNLKKVNGEIDYLLTHTCSEEVSDKFFFYKNDIGDPTCTMISEIEKHIKSPYINYFGHHHTHIERDNHICLYTEFKRLDEVAAKDSN